MYTQESFSQVIKNPGFLNLWINQVLVQLAYNALNFTLIIWVFNLTNSNTAVSVLLFCVYLPAVLLGLFAGVLVDITDRKKIILIINFLLAILFFSLIFLKGYFLAILGIAFLVNTLAQFYTPAESSAIPLLVKSKQLLVANSLFSITLFSSFLIGFALAGPLINLLGINFVFIFGGVLLSMAFLLGFFFPSITNLSNQEGKKLLSAFAHKDLVKIKEVALVEIRQTIHLIRKRLSLFFSIMILGGVQAVIGVLAVIVPAFFERELHIKATDVSQVIVIPLGVGMVLGGLFMGKWGANFPRRVVVGRAIIFAGLLLFLVGIAPLITPIIKYFPYHRPLPFFYQPPLSAVLAVGSFLLGIAMVSIVVPSQTVLQESTPEYDRGKVFAVLGTVMASFSLLPVLISGVIADLFGTTPIFLAVGGTIALLGLLALRPDFYFDEHHLSFKIRQFLGLGHWIKRKD